jgi:hypothetical protein
MLGRRSRIATFLTKQAKFRHRLALGALGGGAAAVMVGADDINRALAGMSPQQMAMRRAMRAKSSFTPSFGYGAVGESLKKRM